MRAYGIVFNCSFDIACNFRCPYRYFDGQWLERAQDRRQ